MKIQTAAFVGLVLLCCSAQAFELDRYDTRMPVQLNSSLDTATTGVNTPFQASLKEAVCYQDKCLPPATQFKGRISKVKAAQSFSTSPYIAIQIDEVKFPDGRTMKLQYDVEQTTKLYNTKQLDKKKSSQKYKVVRAASTAVSFMSVGAGLATRAIGGGAVGLHNKEGKTDEESAVKGAYNSTVLPDAVNFMSEKSDTTYKKGEIVYFGLPAEVMADIFREYQSKSAAKL